MEAVGSPEAHKTSTKDEESGSGHDTNAGMQPDAEVTEVNSVAQLQAIIDQLESRMRKLESSEKKVQLATDTPVTPDPPTEDGDKKATEGSESDSDGTVKVKYETMRQTSTGGYAKEDGRPPGEADMEREAASGDVLTFTAYKSKEGNLEKVMIKIHSIILRNFIREIMQPVLEHENVKIWKDAQVTIQTNNVLVLHAWDDLKAAAISDDGTPQARAELTCFLDNIEKYEAETIEARELAKKERQVTYAKMWTLFPLGSEVVAFPFKDSPQIFTIYRHGPKADGFSFQCWAYDWDGEKLVRHSYEFDVPSFQGLKKVEELPCYPIDFYNSNGEGPQQLRKMLYERGKRFKEYCAIPGSERQILTANEFTLLRDSFDGPRVTKSEASIAQAMTDETSNSGVSVILDPLLYKRYAPGACLHLGHKTPTPRRSCECRLCLINGKRKEWEDHFKSTKGDPEDLSTEDTELNEIFYSQLPPRVLGYVLDRKGWGQMHVDSIKKESSVGKDKSWEELSLEKEHKENIRNMVSKHFERATSATNDGKRIHDLIPGKGDGLVILLHGIPGVGKTMTAEALAREMRRRLLRIDAADFQYNNPSQVSLVFKKFFHLAHSWGAILLLDEADVFLQLRRRAELEQNALVSVLLRELEYFQGVLIMTTNRILSIDNAVQSRINYAVRFPNSFDMDSISKIWKTFMDQLNDDNCRPHDRSNIEYYFKTAGSVLQANKFTGRDIRNIFITAQLLDYPWLTFGNLMKVINSTSKFRSDLAKTSQQQEMANAVTDHDRV